MAQQATTQTAPDGLSDEHLRLFGSIVQCFARHEALLREVMATVSGADVTAIRLLTDGMSFTAQRDALFTLLRHRTVPLDQVDQLRSYVQVASTYAALRQDIVHATWTETTPRTAIQPIWLSHGPLKAVRPRHDLSDGAPPFVAGEEDRTSYTLEDLREINETLARNVTLLRGWLAGVGLGATAGR